MKKEAIYLHGNYCQSGLAYHKKDDKYGDVAVCVSIDGIEVHSNDGVSISDKGNILITDDTSNLKYSDQVFKKAYGSEEKNGKDPMKCIPGKQTCIYTKGGAKKFTQKCECSLNPKNLDQGYCPIPSLYHI